MCPTLRLLKDRFFFQGISERPDYLLNGIFRTTKTSSRYASSRSKQLVASQLFRLQMNGPSRPQGLKVVLKLPKAQPANKPGETSRQPQNSSHSHLPPPLKKRKRVEEPGSSARPWPQPALAPSGLSHPSASRGPTGAAALPRPGFKEHTLAQSASQISSRDPFPSQGQPSLKPRLTVKNAGHTSTAGPAGPNPKPSLVLSPLTAKVGSIPPSKQGKGLKSKKLKVGEVPHSHSPVPEVNGFSRHQDQQQSSAQRPKLKVKQAQSSRQSQLTPSETAGSDPSASALTEDDASYQQQRPLGAVLLSNTAAAEQKPDIPVTRQDCVRVVDRVQQKDWYEIFKEPVTDEVVGLPISMLFYLMACRSVYLECARQQLTYMIRHSVS